MCFPFWKAVCNKNCPVPNLSGIRMALKDNIVYDVQLCYERLGYLPTERAAKGGSYSTFTFNGACPTEAGEILVKESIDLVKSIAEY